MLILLTKTALIKLISKIGAYMHADMKSSQCYIITVWCKSLTGKILSNLPIFPLQQFFSYKAHNKLFKGYL